MVTKKASDKKDEGTTYYFSPGQSAFKAPKIDVKTLLPILENKSIEEGITKQQRILFQNDLKISVQSIKTKEEDADLTASLSDMVTADDVAINFALQRGWRDTAEWGPSLMNPVWDYEGPEFRLKKLKRLPPESFGNMGTSVSYVYNKILPGILLNDKTQQIEYWQTDTQGKTKQLQNVEILTDPIKSGIGGSPAIVPIFPYVKMLSHSWMKQMMKVNQYGSGGIWFLKVTDPTGDDKKFAQNVVNNVSSTNRYQLRPNMTIENLGISESGSALETITQLGMEIRQFFTPAGLTENKGAIIGGSSGPEYDMYMSFISGTHRWLEAYTRRLLNPWLVYNGYYDKGFRIIVDIPAPQVDKSELYLKIAREGNQSGTLSMNEHRSLLRAALPQTGGVDIADLNPEEQAAQQAYAAASKPAPQFSPQLQKLDSLSKVMAANQQRPLVPRKTAQKIIQATLGIEENSDEDDTPLQGDAISALNKLTEAATELSRSNKQGAAHLQAGGEEGNWVTINGTPILIKDGESTDAAFQRTTGKSLSGGSGDAGGSSSKVTNDHKEYDTKLMGALNSDNNQETGKAIAAAQEKGLTTNTEYAQRVIYGESRGNLVAVDNYTSSGHMDINSYLRGEMSEAQATEKLLPRGDITRLDKMIGGSPNLPEGTVLYRGVGEKGVTTMMNMKPGDVCNDKGFQSFSTNPEKSYQFATYKQSGAGGRDKVLIRAVTNGNNKGLVIGGGEHEVLIGRGTGWKVVSNNMVKSDMLTRVHMITVVPA